MTRVNCVPPEELSGPHLVAEYRELPRIFALARAAAARGESPADPRNPPAYTLGRGHVRFFYARLGYLVRRQAALVDEMRARGYAPRFTAAEALIAGFGPEWCNDWAPDEAAMTLNRARIAERLAARKRAPAPP